MALEDVTGIAQLKRFWGIFYGPPGSGKTGLGTAYPDEWGEGVYLAVDNDAASLDSVLRKYRSRLHVVKFKGDDPISNMSEFVVHDWQKEYPKAGVLIVDTVSRAAKQMMKYAANKGYFKSTKTGDAHIQFGPKDAEITQSLPAMSDYGGTQHLLMNWVDLLFQHQSHMNIILLAHQYLYIPGKEDPPSSKTRGGPDTIGKGILEEFASEFPVVVRLDVNTKKTLDGKTVTKYRAISAMDGTFTARIKEGEEGGNPMSVVDLERDGQHWYRTWMENFMKEGV